jgi:hypothetical protein
VRRLLPDMLAAVTQARLPASVAARRLLDAWHPRPGSTGIDDDNGAESGAP